MRKYWTDSEIQEVKHLYPNNYSNDIAKHFGVDVRKVYSLAFRFKLKKSTEFLKMELSRQADRLKVLGKASHFKPGHISHNKGQKMSKEAYEKCSATMFKSGIVPHNIKFDGYERTTVDGYIEVRIKKGVFKLKHRLIYEQHYGPIPKGMYIIFKDKNKLNFDIDNLELISLKEHMARNTIQRFPKELKQLIHLNTKLKKLTNEKQN
jgi:HNH endonuclease